MAESKSVVAIVLNWNAADATVRCVFSILNFCPGIMKVVVVDNASSDGSAEVMASLLSESINSGKVDLIVNEINAGYAGGNNFGIRHALSEFGFKFIWIVNNDAFVQDDALSPMLARFACSDARLIVGSVVVRADEVGTLECYGGGRYFPLLGRAKLYKKGVSLVAAKKGNFKPPSYIMGCSLLFPVRLLRDVGLMDEGYFMYSEEIDWQRRAVSKGYAIDVAPLSVVYHEGSASSDGRSATYYYLRSRAAIRFNRKFYGNIFALISVFNLCLISAFTVFKGVSGALHAMKGAVDGLFMPVEKK